MHTRKHHASALRWARLVLFILLMSGVVCAQITPLGDSYTNSAAPTINYGAKTLLDVDGATQITYIQFNLASIPSGASVSQATLKLYVNSVTTAGSFNVDYVNGTWSEGTITWNDSPALGTTIVSSVPITTKDKNQYILINLTPAVEAWLNGSQANDGIALVANGTFNATFDSKENTGTSHPAELDVVFAGSGGGTITGVLTAAGSGLQGGGTSGTLNLSLLTSCGSGQVLEWNGSAWACTSLSGGGTITGVTAGTDLTGGGTSGNVTLNLDITKVPQLNASNTFNGNQTINGNLSASGYQIGGSLFDFGSSSAQNAFLGFAGNSTTTGGGNIAAGYQALANNTTGNLNTASGDQALYNNGAGNANVATGGTALLYNTTGSYNTATGSAALPYNTTGSYNTAAGFKPGAPVDGTRLTGSWNTFLGAQANPSTGGLSNATAIGAYSEVGESNALVLGCTYGVNNCSAWTAVGIGTPTPAFSLDVNGSINTSVGYNLGGVMFDAGLYPARNASLGFAGNTGYGTDNTAVGYQALYANEVSQNTAVGSGALRSNAGDPGGDGTKNTAIGFQALYNNNDTSGFGDYARNNTAMGWGALSGNTKGSYNTASGAQALQQNTSSYNTAVGQAALYDNTAGSNNTASGAAAGTTIGFQQMTGSYNTFLGAYTVQGLPSGSNATAIGAFAEVDESNALVLGCVTANNNCPGALNVGIGTTAPISSLEIALLASGTLGPTITLTNQGGPSAAMSLDFNSYTSSGNYNPAARIKAVDVGGGQYSDELHFQANKPGGPDQGLQDTMTIDPWGNVHVVGTLSKASGSFKIDHPLDPANKYLYHSFVESPDMMNIYNGNVVTDKRGLATIELPDWFEALNRDFRYQLTVIGQFAQAIVVQKVKNNHFTIKTSKPGVEVSWQVTGIRQDAYANAHRIRVEEVKPPAEQGHYLHPELFGAGPEKAVHARAAEPAQATTAQTAALASKEGTAQ